MDFISKFINFSTNIFQNSNLQYLFQVVCQMGFQEKVFDLSVHYQNMKLKSLFIRLGYFFFKYILKIPILSSFFLVQSQLFKKVRVGETLVQIINQPNDQMQIIYQSVLIAYFFTLSALIFLGYKERNKLQNKLLFMIMMVLQVSNALGCYFLISIMTAGWIFVLYRLLAVFIFIILQILLITIDRVLISFQGQKYNRLSHNINDKIFVLNILENIIYCATILIGKINKEQNQYQQIFYLLIFLIYGFRIYIYIREKYYIDDISNLLQIFGSVICLTLLLVVEIYEIFLQTLLQENFFYACFTVGIFAMFAIFAYLKYTQNQLLFLNLQQIVENKQFHFLLQSLNRLWKYQKKSYYSLLIKSFLKIHRIECRNIQIIKNDQCKNRKFLKKHIKGIFKHLLKHTKDTKIILQILFFLLQSFGQCVIVNQKLKQISNDNKQNDFSLKVGFYILNDKIHKMIQRKINQNCTLNIMAIIQLEQKVCEMQKVIISDIHIKAHKWKNLRQSVCKSSDIQEDIINEISNIICFQKIYSENKLNYTKSISFNTLSLFYFGQITFLKKQVQQIEYNLKDLSKNVKKNFIDYQKELEFNTFSDKSCLIEFSIVLKQQFSAQMQLVITNCNKNTLKIFKSEKTKLLGNKAEKLFPFFLREQANKFLENLFQIKYDFSKVQNRYFIDKFKHVFQALVNIKIVSKKDQISCVFFILQKQAQKVILLNNHGLIQNVGNLYISNFSTQYEKIPFYCLVHSDQQIQQLQFDSQQRKQTYTMFDPRQMQEGWKIYLKKVRQYIQKKDVGMVIDFNMDEKNLKNKKILNKQYFQFLKKQKKQLIGSTKKISSALTNGTRRGSNPLRLNPPLLTVSIQYKKCSLNNQTFFSIKLVQIIKKKPYQNAAISFGNISDKNKTINHPIKRADRQRQLNNSVKMQQNSFLPSNQMQRSYVNEHQQDQSQKSQTNKLLDEDKVRNRDFIIETNSTHSSLRTENLVYFNSNFVKICFNLFKNSDQINDKRLKFYTFNSILVSLVFSALLCGSYMIFKLSFYEVKDIFYANSAVSDVMQLTLFMYNRAMNLKLFRNNIHQLQMIRESALFERLYLFKLMSYTQKNFLIDVTSMSNTKFYQYLRVPVMWKSSATDEFPAQIQTNQLLLFFYRLSSQIQQNCNNLTQKAQQEINLYLKLMQHNFLELKRINHSNLFLYKRLSDQSLNLIRKLIIFLSLSHFLISFFILLIFYRERLFRRNQQSQGYSIYKIIPRSIFEMLAHYFENLSQENKNQNDLMQYETFFVPYNLQTSVQSKSYYKPNRSKFITKNSKSSLAIWRMFFTLLLLNTLYGISIYNTYELVQPIKLMMDNINEIMGSYNYLLEGYFDLKSKFIIEDQLDINQKFFYELLVNQNKTEVQFNQMAVKSLDLFTNYDSTYTNDFINLLIDDACDIAKSQITLKQYQKCKNFFKLNFLQNGVMMGMNFLTRKVKEIIYQFKIKIMQTLQMTQTFKQQIKMQIQQKFRSPDFRQMDQSIFFIFKLFQAIQARIIKSLQKTIQQTVDFSLVLILIQIFIVGIMYPIILLRNYRAQKIQLSKLYLSFLLIPTPVSKSIKSFSEKIQSILELD